MLFDYWIKGIILGILATAPLGPVSIMVIQRTLNHNRRVGFYSGVGIALSDTLYASLAGFGMVLVIGIIRQNELWFRLGGSVVLLALGVIIFLSHPERIRVRKLKVRTKPMKYLAGTFAIAITNPHVIFYILAIFSGFGIALTIEQPYMAFFLLLGFFTGDILWWFTITWLMDRYRNKFSLKFLVWFNRLAGAGIVAFVLVFLTITIYQHLSV